MEIPSWRTLADTPPQREDGAEPAEPKVGWQHRATRCLEDQHLRVQLWPTLTDPVPRIDEISVRPVGICSTDCFANESERPDWTHNLFRMWLCRRFLPPTPTVLSALADVAAFLTKMATIVQRVRGLGCWEPGVSRLSELPHRYAGRQVGAWGLTDLFVIWTSWRSMASISAVLRSSLMVSPCGTEHSSQWTPLWCLLCIGDGSARRNAATTSGVALRDARRAKERTYP